MRLLFLALLMSLAAATALAADTKPAPPVEDVTVTGARTRQAIEGFVQSLATPTHATDKIARWQKPVCATVAGLKRDFARFILARLKTVATQTGAPVNSNADCEPNLAIVFTTTPQALIDNVRKKTPGLLGYHDNQDQLAKLATVSRPIQAWYTTATQDAFGNETVDSARMAGPGLDLQYQCPDGGICTTHLSNAHAAATTTSHLGDGLRSGLYNVIIVADPTRLTDYEMGTLSDYIAMLTLAQVSAPDGCQPLASIVNLLAPDCANKPNALTANDLGYLSALYKMSPDSTMQVQRHEMTYQMQKALGLP